MTLYSKYTRVLTSEIFCQALQIHVHPDARFDPREEEQALASGIQTHGDNQGQPGGYVQGSRGGEFEGAGEGGGVGGETCSEGGGESN